MSKKDITAVIWKEGKWFVARALGFELASQGRTRKEAANNLREAFELLVEDDEIQIPYSQIPQKPEIHRLYA